MNQPPSSHARRDFLRTCTVTGIGLASGLPLQHAVPATLPPTDANPPVRKIVVALTISESAAMATVAEWLPDGPFNILGSGSASALGGSKRGEVDSVAGRVRAALEEAEIQSGVKIRRVVVIAAGEGGWIETGIRSAQDLSIEVESIIVAPLGFASALERSCSPSAPGLENLPGEIKS